MKKSLRFLSLFIAVIFMISGAVMIVCSADELENGDPPIMNDDPGTGGDTPIVDDPDTGNETPVVEDPDISGNQTGGDNSIDGDGQAGGYVDYDDGGDDDGSGYSGYSYVNDDDRLFYGDYELDYEIENIESAGAVSSNTPLYNSSGMSAAEAAPNEWSDIVLDEKTVKTGVSDFSAIKSNTEVEDNGDWILYLGYALLALSALGILYFIVATIAHRKSVRKAERMERRRASSPARSDAARMEAGDRRAAAASGRTSRFADDSSYSRRTSSRADTGEVYVPRRAAKRH
ncbi:MAG: hypothetical protein IJH07_01000 [Ruminococcus sp.]|nr:hypothetical protein [Ruminococcus sp.]